jgi:dihydrofolate reductase
MRKIIVLTFISLDGVMQAPGGPQEDTDSAFEYGGWLVPHFDERLGAIMNEQMAMPLDLLLGRRTYEIFASYWPEHESEWPGINSAIKYVVSDTRTDPLWDNTIFIKGNVVEEIRKLKQQGGPDLQVHGSKMKWRFFVATASPNGIFRTWWISKIFPLTLGRVSARQLHASHRFEN